MRNCQTHNSVETCFWVLVIAIVIFLSILTVSIIREKIDHRRQRSNDDSIFRSVRRARRDFR